MRRALASHIPHHAEDLYLDHVTFSDLRVNDGRKSMFVNYLKNKMPPLQTPWLTSWGIESSARFESVPTGGEPRLSMKLLMESPDSDEASHEEVAKFKRFMTNLDDKILDMATLQSYELFKKKTLSKETAREAMLNATVKTSAKGSESMKVGISAYNPPIFYDAQRQILPREAWEETLTGKMKVRAILECRPLWFMSNKFGVKWEIRQMECVAMTSQWTLPNYAFRVKDDASAQRDVSIVNANTANLE